MMAKDGGKKFFLGDLGRATMRGLRRCRKCGTLNGTRGFTCKNKTCDVVFKAMADKPNEQSKPCKINTGSHLQVFSVRLRGKGPDYRSFVQFPSNSSSDDANLLENFSLSDDSQIGGMKCYAESCQRMSKYSSLIPSQSNLCVHIKAAIQCTSFSEPLTFKMTVLNSLPIPQPMKEDLYSLATDTPGPLVQRISKFRLVIKCKVDAAHPLGFLHFSLALPKNKKDAEPKFYCTCSKFKNDHSKTSSPTFRKCVHFYACIVAFASDSRLIEEFRKFVDLVQQNQENREEEICVNLVVEKDGEGAVPSLDGTIMGGEVADHFIRSLEAGEQRSFFVISDPDAAAADASDDVIESVHDHAHAPCEVQVEVVDDSAHIFATDDDNLKGKFNCKGGTMMESSEMGEMESGGGSSITVTHLEGPNQFLADANSTPASSMIHSPIKSKANIPPDSIMYENKKQPSAILPSEGESSLTFIKWLASVVERINQTMHFGFHGMPDPLVFHVPKVFFDCLFQRLIESSRLRKQELSIETETFIRKEAVPLGKFTKHTLRISTLIQVLDVFHNSVFPLETVRFFTFEKDGSFKVSNPPEVPYTRLSPRGSSSVQPIKPREFKTVLKVGPPNNASLSDPSCFVLEWIPNILPVSQIGELRLRFEFDHYCNGQLTSIKQILNPTSILVSKPPPPLNTHPPTPVKSTRPTPLAPRPPQKKILLNSDPTNSILVPMTNTSTDTITVLTF